MNNDAKYSNNSMNLGDMARSISEQNSLNPSGYGIAGYDPHDQQKKLMELQMELQNMKKKSNMDTKLTKIAELFELDVLDEEEALKACKMVISQHAKVRGKTGTSN